MAWAGVIAWAPPATAHEPVTPPIAAQQPQAMWPGDKPGIHDVIVPVVLSVSATGEVQSAEVEASLNAEFDAAACDAARRWTFQPAIQEGKPVASKIRAIVRFVGQPRAASAATAPTTATAGTTAAAAPTTATSGTTAAASLAPSPAEVPHGPSPAPTEPHATTSYGGAAEPAGVTVTGARNAPPRSASEVTQGKAVLSAAPHRTASDLLLTVPGLALAQHSGEGAAAQIFFRGFDAVHGQDLEIWAGGAPVNDVSNIHGQGYADLNFLPPEVVKQIRLAPGTYDPRQGDFSVAGSVWMDLGYDEPGLTAKASAGQFNTRRYFLAYRPKSSSDATFAAFELYSTDGFGPSRATRRGSVVAQTEQPISDMVARLMVSTYATSFASAGVLRLDDVTSGRVDRFGSYDEHQGGDASRSQLVVELAQTDETSRWSVAPYVVLRSMRLREDFTGYLVQPLSGTAAEVAAADKAALQGNSEQQINDATTFGVNAHYRRALPVFAPSDTIEAGISARYDRVRQSQKKLSIDTSEVTLDEVDAKINATDAAAYVDLALHPLPRLTVRGGLRIDELAYATEDDGGHAQGQRRAAQGAHLGTKGTADFVLLPGPRSLRALASYGDGFRSPQARSLQEGENAPFTKVQSYELGLRFQSEAVRATGAVFRTVLSDDLAFNQVTARNDRTPPTRRTGLSLEMASHPTPWLDAAASATYTRAEFTNTDGGYTQGDLLPYAPQVVLRADLAFQKELGHIGNRPLTGHFGLGGTGLARRPLPYGEMGHDAYLLDVLATCRLQEFELGISAYNVFNAHWYSGEYVFPSNFQRGAAPSLVPERHVTVGAPRTLLATLSLYL